MPIVRAEVVTALSLHGADELRSILLAAGLPASPTATARELAEQIAEALWWHATTPLGFYAERTFLEDIVDRVARKLGVTDRVATHLDGWGRLASLSRTLFEGSNLAGVSLEDLDAHTRARLAPNWVPSISLGIGSTGSAGTAWATGRLLGLLRGPFGRLIPLLPPLAPYYRVVVGSLGAVQLVAWPLAVGLAVLSANSALGANDRKLVPLLLGVSALAPRPVVDATEL